jgi:hypothetical protein
MPCDETDEGTLCNLEVSFSVITKDDVVESCF